MARRGVRPGAYQSRRAGVSFGRTAREQDGTRRRPGLTTSTRSGQRRIGPRIPVWRTRRPPRSARDAQAVVVVTVGRPIVVTVGGTHVRRLIVERAAAQHAAKRPPPCGRGARRATAPAGVRYRPAGRGRSSSQCGATRRSRQSPAGRNAFPTGGRTNQAGPRPSDRDARQLPTIASVKAGTLPSDCRVRRRTIPAFRCPRQQPRDRPGDGEWSRKLHAPIAGLSAGALTVAGSKSGPARLAQKSESRPLGGSDRVPGQHRGASARNRRYAVVPVPWKLQAMTDLAAVMVRQLLEPFLRDDAAGPIPMPHGR